MTTTTPTRDSISFKIVQNVPLTFLERKFWRVTSAAGQLKVTSAQAAELEIAAIAKELGLDALSGIATANEECEKRWEEWFLNRTVTN